MAERFKMRLLTKLKSNLGWYWLRYRTWYRFHVLKLRYLTPGYHDADERLIHAMFAVLCDFMKNEKPDEIVNWESDPGHAHAWSEMNILWNWWVHIYQNREEHNPLFFPGVEAPDMGFSDWDKDKIFNPITNKEERTREMHFVHKSKEAEEHWHKACEETTVWEDKCNKEDEEMMTRLIKIRHYLWT